MSEIFYNKNNISSHYIDLRNIIDDKTVLKNPHKGWYYHYVDNGLTRSCYRDGIEKGSHLEEIPCLNHLYLRIDWCDIEPTEGNFNWSWIDDIFDEWSKYGYRFSFRICTYETSIAYATPEWVRLAGAKGMFFPSDTEGITENGGSKRWEPDYGDPIFLQKLSNMLKAFGERYNGNSLVEFVDIGTFGTWGEGHRGFGSGTPMPIDVLRAHVNLHLKYLPDTVLLLNDDMVVTGYFAEGTDAVNDFIDYCIGKGIGARDDSLCVKMHLKDYGYDTLRLKNFFDRTHPSAPVDLEFEHYSEVSDEAFRDGFPFLEALKNTHATYAGFHGYPHPWIDDRYYFTEYVANRLGYWYFITGLILPECVSGTKSFAKLYIENRGWAKAYNSYTLKLFAVGKENTYELFSADGLNLRWDEKITEVVILDFKDVPKGEYKLAVGLYENKMPIKIAIKEEYCTNGMYILCDFSVGELQF